MTDTTTTEQVDQESRDLELSGELIPLVEKAVRKDGTALIKIIQPGWGSSGFYPAEVLERDGPKVFKAQLHTYWDHPSASEDKDRPERSLRDLAGVLTKDAYWDANGQAGPGLYAETRVTEQYRGAVAELAPNIGMSIRAYGKAREGEVDGRKGNIIEQLVSARSVDYVTCPGAGGQILELFEAAGRLPAKGENQVSEEEAKQLREANESLMNEAAAKDALIASLREAVLMRQAQEVAGQVLAEIEMPTATRQRIMAAQAAKTIRGEDGNLDESAYREQVKTAAQAELAYLNEIRGSGKITGMGAGVNVTGAATLKESFKAMYLKQGKSADEAERMASVASQGR